MTIGRTVVGVDTAKRVFQLHWVDMETGEIMDLKLTRARFLEHFANRAPCLVAMEACGGSQHWARRLQEFGHEVRLLPAKMVRPFVGGNKNDAHDARAIWTAAQQPGVKAVAIKSEEQQAILALHRMRQQLVKFRTAQTNCLRGLLTEYGEVMPQGRAGMRRGMAAALERVSDRLPAMVIDTLREQWARVARVSMRRSATSSGAQAMAPGQRRQPADRGHPRCRSAKRDRRGRCDGRPRRVQVRTGVCRLARPCTQTQRYRRTGTHARHLQARGPLPAHPSDPRCPVGVYQQQGATRMGVAPRRAPAVERGHRGAGQQDGAHDLGLAGP